MDNYYIIDIEFLKTEKHVILFAHSFEVYNNSSGMQPVSRLDCSNNLVAKSLS